MNYFMTAQQRAESGSTCYFEFQKGAYRRKHWQEDGLFLHADVFDQLQLYDLFSSVIPDFAYYGVTAISKDQWMQITELSRSKGGAWQAVIEELSPWAEACFQKKNVFTVCGI